MELLHNQWQLPSKTSISQVNLQRSCQRQSRSRFPTRNSHKPRTSHRIELLSFRNSRCGISLLDEELSIMHKASRLKHNFFVGFTQRFCEQGNFFAATFDRPSKNWNLIVNFSIENYLDISAQTKVTVLKQMWNYVHCILPVSLTPRFFRAILPNGRPSSQTSPAGRSMTDSLLL
jgi:hypothetical protein